jgi:PAS domain S-box-containing protein
LLESVMAAEQRTLAQQFERKAAHYAFAVLVVVLGLALRWPFWEVLEGQVPYLTFFPAVMLSAWRGGVGPGLVSTGLSAIVAIYFFQPPDLVVVPSRVATWTSILLFLSTGAFISWLAQLLQNSRIAEERQRRLSELTLSGIGDAVIATDEVGRVKFMNPVAVSLTGWRFEDARDAPVSRILNIVDEATAQPVSDAVARVGQDSRTQDLAGGYQLIARSGAAIPIDISASPIHDSDDTAFGTVLIFRDVSLRRQSEKDLMESRERLRITLESIADGFIAIDRQMRLVYANSRPAERSGWKECTEQHRSPW